MAQSALTVTPPNPTPPTNLSCTGATPPNPPNYTKLTYEDYRLDTDFDTNPPPYFDDGVPAPTSVLGSINETSGSRIVFASNTSALASGSGATAGGTEGSYPGAASGTVPASTSVAHEGAGTELAVTQTYSAGIYNPGGSLVSVSTGPVITAATLAAGPNGSHASTLSPATNPALVSIGLGSSVAGGGTTLLTCTGTNFVPGCKIWVNGAEVSTTYVGATSLTSTINKKATASPPTWPVVVKLGGVQMGVTATITWT